MNQHGGFVAKIVFLIVIFPAFTCTARRDNELKALYQDGKLFLREAEAALAASKSSKDAAAVIRERTPALKALVDRKKQLEKDYPDLANADKRESIHGKFSEFIEFRLQLRQFYDFGGKLFEKYGKDPEYKQAVRAAMTHMSYF